MSLWAYVKNLLFETNRFTLVLVAALGFFSIIKYLKISNPFSKKQILIGIVILGLALRIAWLLFSSHTPQFSWNPQHMLEGDIINVHAIDITKGRWFLDDQGVPMARRPIGYPMFLGLLYTLFGVHLRVFQISTLALFLASLFLIYKITKLLVSERAACLAAFIFSIYPISIYSVPLIVDEHLFLPLWYFGIYLLLMEIHGKKIRWAPLWYGLIFGYATMIRTHTIFMPAVVMFAYYRLKFSWKKIIYAGFGVFLVMQLVNLPWVIRNYKVWGVPVLYTATSGNVYQTFNGSATPEGGGHVPLKGEPGYSREFEAAQESGNHGLSHQLASKEMLRWAVQNPKEAFLLGIKRIFVFIGWNRAGVWPTWYQFYEGSFDPVRPISPHLKYFFEETAYTFYYVLLFAFIFSIIYLWKRRKAYPRPLLTSLLTVGSCILFWLMEHMIIYPERKYRFPLEPLMIVIACAFIDYLVSDFRWEKLWQRKQRQ